MSSRDRAELVHGTPRWKASEAGAVMTAAVMIAVLVTLLLPLDEAAGLDAFTPEHVDMLAMVASTAQRLAHRVGLVLLAALCALGAVAIVRPAAHAPAVTMRIRVVGRWLMRYRGALLLAAAALVPLFDLQGTSFPGPVTRTLRFGFLAASLVVAAVASWKLPRKSRVLSAAIAICIAWYAVFLTLPGLRRVPILLGELLIEAEWHYALTVAQGDRLAAGLQLGSHVNLNYGLVSSLALAAWERHHGLLSFGEHFRLVQLSQFAFLAMAIAAFYSWRPKNPWFALFATLWVGPWLSTIHLAIYYPNQAGWRNLGLAAGVALLLALRRQPFQTASYALGAGAGFLLFYNPEIGACLSFGYALFLISRLDGRASPSVIAPVLRALTGAVFATLVVLVCFRLALGTWPPRNLEPLLGFIRRFSGGYGSLPLYFDPLALLIASHAVYVVGSSIPRWRVRALTVDESARLALSGTLVVWFAYYVNRPGAWNLWTYQFLYVFLAADLVEPRVLRRLREGAVASFPNFRFVALVFVLLPMLLATNYSIFSATIHEPRVPFALDTLSGVSMPTPSASNLRTQAAFLRRQDASSTLYFTRHAYSMSLLTGRFNSLSVQEPFAETLTHADFDRLVGEILGLTPRTILFDASERGHLLEGGFVSTFYGRFFERLQRRLVDRYRPGPTTDGWQVWQLR